MKIDIPLPIFASSFLIFEVILDEWHSLEAGGPRSYQPSKFVTF